MSIFKLGRNLIVSSFVLMTSMIGDAVIAQETEGVTAPKPVIEPWGYPLDAFDRETRPQDDFYRFANGGWLDTNEIPGDRSGIGFSIVMRERNEERMNTILDELIAHKPKRGTDGQKIRDLYLGFMNGTRIEKIGLKPFAKDLARIHSLETHEDVARAMADSALGLDGPFSFSVAIDSKDPENYAVWATHSGLSMPDRSYYLRQSERLEKTRTAYLEYLKKIIDSVGEGDRISAGSQALIEAVGGEQLASLVKALDDATTGRGEAVFELEKAIATHHWPRAERRNASRTYNVTTLPDLAGFAPGFPWAVFVKGLSISEETKIIIREKEAFPALADLFSETPVEVWRDYLLVQYINSNAQFMPKTYDEMRFEFH